MSDAIELEEAEAAQAAWPAATQNLPAILGPWSYLNWGHLILTDRRLIFARRLDTGDSVGIAETFLQVNVPLIIPFPNAFGPKRPAIGLDEIAEVRPERRTLLTIIEATGSATRFTVSKERLNLGPWSEANRAVRDAAVASLRAAIGAA
jgi:hypothetical protein